MLRFRLQLYRWTLSDDALHGHLNKFIEAVELLSNETLVVKVRVNDDPAGFLPEFIGDFLIFFIVVS